MFQQKIKVDFQLVCAYKQKREQHGTYTKGCNSENIEIIQLGSVGLGNIDRDTVRHRIIKMQFVYHYHDKYERNEMENGRYEYRRPR
jgi:hypothetical protein